MSTIETLRASPEPSLAMDFLWDIKDDTPKIAVFCVEEHIFLAWEGEYSSTLLHIRKVAGRMPDSLGGKAT